MYRQFNFINGNKKISFKDIEKSDIDNILKFQDDNINPKTFCKLSRNELTLSYGLDKLIGAYCNGVMIGFCLIILPIRSKRSLFNDINKEFEDVITFDAVIVDKHYRGLGLQCKFIDITKNIAKNYGINYIAATVSPDNIYSKQNFINSGFKVICQKKKYNGKDRLIMECKITID